MTEGETDRCKRLEEENRSLRARLRELERRHARKGDQGEERYRILVQQAFDGAILVDEKISLVLEVTNTFLARLGYDEKDHAVPFPLSALLFDKEEDRELSALVGSKRELRFVRKDGSALDAEVRAVRLPAGGRSTLCLIIQDLTERKLLEHSLRHEATHDHLTGLPNRRFFSYWIQQEISYHRRRQKTLAILVLDLDNFKRVNDTLGHRAGDALLRDFAHRLRQTVREYDVVARFGGDEFQIGIIDVGSRDNVAHVARKVLALFDAPFQVGGQCIDYVTGSIGIAIFPGDGEDAETLFTCADAALYAAKRNGKSRFTFFGRGDVKALATCPGPIAPP